MQRTSSPIPRAHQRVYPSEQFSTASHGSYDQDSAVIGSGGMDTSFELMSASQLRDQLRKEQYKRRESQAEVEALKSAATGYLGVDTSRYKSLPTIRTYEYPSPSNGHDSDSGISHTMSGSRAKSPFGLPPADTTHLRSTSRRLPARPPSVIPQAEEPWSLSPASGAIKDMQDAMYESEQRRLALVEKLREAHETLQTEMANSQFLAEKMESTCQVQTQRLCDSEAKLNDRHYAMENMSSSNQSLQRKLSSIQRDREVAMEDKLDTMKQRQVLESKVEGLDRELKNLRLAYAALQAEQGKRDQIVEQTSRALSLVEEENNKFQHTKESMLKEAIALRESLQMSKAKCDKLEADNKDLEQVKQDLEILVARNSDLNGQLQGVKHAHYELENENELLKGDFRKAREEREVFQSRALQLEEKCADLSAKCVSSAATKEKLMQEKLDLQQLLNQSTHEREQVNKARQLLENQITDMQLEVTQSKLAAETKEEEMERMTEELNALKKVGEVLSTELSTAKQNLEKLQEDMRQVTTDKRTAQQQQTYWEEEAKRLSNEKEALNKALDQQKEEFGKERDQMSEQHQTIRENLKEMRTEKAKAQSKCQELETMLHRANDEIEACSIRHQEEVEEWKASCERLSASTGRKDNEIATLAEQLQEAQDQGTQFKAELQTAQRKNEQLLEQRDEMDRLREENKRLTQEHGEDQQVIHLLEMQKNILAKNQSSTQHRQTVDQLQAQVDHLKAELGLAEDKILEAKEELARERSQGSDHYGYGVAPSRSARSTPAPCENCQLLHDQVDKLKEMNKIFTDKIKKLETDTSNHQTRAKTLSEMESKCRDLQTQIQSLNNINSLMNDKVARLEREKAEVMQNVPAPGEVISTSEFDQLEKEKDRLHTDYTHLKEDYSSLKEDYGRLKSTFNELEGLHQQLVAEKVKKTHEPSREEREQLEADVRKVQQENDTLQRQIELLRSQAMIAENAKMRAEDKIRILEKEIQDLQMQISAERQKSRRSSLSSDVETTSLRTQLDERNQIIQQLQLEIASKNLAMENLRQGVDNRVFEKIRELEDVLQERDNLDETRRKLDQQKLALEIKLEEQRLIIEQLRGEKPRLLQEKDAEIERLDRQKTKLENDLRNLKEQLREKDTELLRLQMRQGSELGNFQEEYEKSLERKENQIRTLKQELEDLRDEKPKQLKQSLESVEEELASVRSELERVNGMINVKETQIQEQDRQLQMAEMRHDEAVRDRNEHRRRMQKELDEREDTITDLQRQLDVVKSEISIHQDQADDKTKRFQERIQSQSDEIKSLGKEMRDLKSTNRNLSEEKQTQQREIQKLKAAGVGKCNKCERLSAEKEEVLQEKESLEEEVGDLHQEVDRLQSLLNVAQQDKKSSNLKAKETQKTPVKEDILSPIRRSLVESAKPTSITSAPSSRQSSRSGSPAHQASTVNPLKLAAAMKRLSLKPSDVPKRTLSPSPGSNNRMSSIKDTGILSNREPIKRNPTEVTPTASANNSRRSSLTSLEQADRQRGLSPEPTNAEKDRRQSVRDIPTKTYQERSRTSLNDLEARLKSLQSSSKAKKAAVDQNRDRSPGGDARKKQTKFVLPSSKKFEKGSRLGPGD